MPAMLSGSSSGTFGRITVFVESSGNGVGISRSGESVSSASSSVDVLRTLDTMRYQLRSPLRAEHNDG